MAEEIERKFLVTGDDWRTEGVGIPYTQGYLSRDPERVVRIRRAGERAFLTVKGLTRGISRSEFEYPIPLADFAAMRELCDGPVVEKIRTVVDFSGKRWEVDEFQGANAGLIVAEIELAREDETFPLPPWVGKEVSDDPRYSNVRLASEPFTTWSE